LREFGSPPVWEPAREPWRWETGGSSFRALHGHGLEASRLLQQDILPLGAVHDLQASLTVLHPTMETWPRRSDDRTLVLRIDLGSFRVLWCNDAGFLAEKTMLQTLPAEALRCDVIVRNQHAGDFSMLPEFLDATRPRVMISSNNTFPPEQTVTKGLRKQCAVRGIQLLDQAETGAVTMRVWPDQMVLEGMRDLSPVTFSPVRPGHPGPAP
jgi:competence protein ComEC